MILTPRDQERKRMYEAVAASNKGAERFSGGTERTGPGAIVRDELTDSTLGASLDGASGGVQGVRGEG
jgi:hypothetical protein